MQAKTVGPRDHQFDAIVLFVCVPPLPQNRDPETMNLFDGSLIKALDEKTQIDEDKWTHKMRMPHIEINSSSHALIQNYSSSHLEGSSKNK